MSFLRRPCLDELKKAGLFINQTPLTSSSVDGRNISLLTSDPIRTCIVFMISEICYFRTTEILVSGVQALKYVNMYLGQLQ